MTILEPLNSPTSNPQRTGSKSLSWQHSHPLQKRIFVGPILEKQLEAAVQKGKKRLPRFGSADVGDAHISQFIKDHAFAFFIQQGGTEEDWDEQGVREEMLRRWRESEWGLFRRKQNADKHAKLPKWIGSSFEVGNILGVNVLQEQAESIRASSSHRPLSLADYATSMTQATSFFTAPAPAPSSVLLTGADDDLRRTQSDFGGGSTRPALQMSSPVVKSDSQVPVIRAQRAVHYAETPDRAGSGNASPAPPSEVLSRSPAEIPDTSAAGTVDPSSPAHWEDFFMRDRMLVRVGYTKNDSMGPVFNEEVSRTARGVRYEEWSEFIVQWQSNVIQFYEPYNMPGTKWIAGPKHRLAHIVPLKSSHVKLSLYSFTDLTFCLTCPPATFRSHDKKISSRALFRRAKEGTDIFICKLKSRSRAEDWMWSIWRRLGGTLPTTIDVRNPALDLHVKIETPEPRLPGKDAPEMFTIDNVTNLCMQELRRVKDWEELIERQLAQGKELRLAWRMGTELDWLCEETDVRGQPRKFAVLCGLAMQQSYPAPQLELRLAQHLPQYSLLKNGARISEPASIEGYLERIRPNSQSKQLMYLVSHEGCLFALPPNQANPPSPLGIDPALQTAEDLRLSEVQRGTNQILEATGVLHLRSVLAVRRAFQPALPTTHDVQQMEEEGSFLAPGSPVERCQSDEDDEGGEDVLRAAQDKPHLKMKRSFELLLKNGHVVRFEGHSTKVALEWLERLRDLISYWRQRDRIEAAEEMELAQAYRPRLTPRRHLIRNESEVPPEAPVDATAPLPTLANLYNLCPLESCKPIARCGRLYMRRGLYGQYKFVHLFLISGFLVQFHITPKSSLHPAMHKKINLADAYVCSGFLAASSLPTGQYSPDKTPLPRRYQDSLETDDSDEDTLFILWYHPHKADVPPLPPLGAKRKTIVFRCRNRLERDTWCWALNCEIEKLVRGQREREEELRNMGGSFN
ncbi:Pleckstrin homology domain-containing protein [Mycena amicta]|nr:Pleckstrin homology domain-containing protein [Mycena amicta]